MTRSSRWIAQFPFAAALVLGLAACGGESLVSTPAAPVPRIETTECSFTLPPAPYSDGVQCGDLIVPENRQVANGRTIRLAFAVFKATGANPVSDPWVYVGGGPGWPALEYVSYWVPNWAAPYQEKRNLVYFDQRGAGRSRPSLDCPETRAEFVPRLAENLTVEEEATLALEDVRTCHDRLVSEGIDLTAYTSAASALDLHDLMTTLGYRQWNVLGDGYGSRVVLTAMRDAAEGIRSVFLMSNHPVQWQFPAYWSASFQRSLDTMFANCATDAACNAAYPDLEEKFFQLVNQLNAEPVTVHPVNAGTGKQFTVVVTGDRLLSGTQVAFYDNTLIPGIPATVMATLEGDYDLLTQGVANLFPFVKADGVYFSVLCAEAMPFVTPEVVEEANKNVRAEIKHLGVTSVTQFTLDVCKFWGSKAPAAIENQPVSSDIPALLGGGEYDPIAPPDNAKLAGKTLSQHYFYEFRGFGVGVWDPCMVTLYSSFLDDPLHEPDGSCVDDLPPLEFIVEAK